MRILAFIALLTFAHAEPPKVGPAAGALVVHGGGRLDRETIAIDQHVIARKREDDMLPVLAAHPKLLGLGLDEGTAIIVQGDRARVIGASRLAVYDTAFTPGADGKRYFLLSPGEVLDLATRRKATP